MGSAECVEGARFFIFHQPHPENTRDHHCTQKSGRDWTSLRVRHGRNLRPSRECWTRNGERRPDGGCGSRLRSPRCANVACSKTEKVEVRGEHDPRESPRQPCAGWVPQLTWRESHRSSRSDTETRAEWKRSELRELLLPRFQVRTSCNGWTSLSGGQQVHGGIGKNRETCSHARERERTKKYGNNNDVGPTVKPISIELGGRMGPQTVNVLQNLTTKLAEARGGELHAATALRKMKLVVERTLIRAEADAINATAAHEEQTNVRRMLLGTDQEDDVHEHMSAQLLPFCFMCRSLVLTTTQWVSRERERERKRETFW